MFEPANEQGVIVLFAQMAKEAGIEFIEVGTAFPDAAIRWQGNTYRVEFEYEGKNFLAHKHDVRKCDFLICWTSDLPNDFPLPVIVINEELSFQGPPDFPSDTIREIYYWKRRARLAEAKLSQHVEFPPALGKAETRAQAKEIIEVTPEISGVELAKRLGCSGSYGRKLKRELVSDPPDVTGTTITANGSQGATS